MEADAGQDRERTSAERQCARVGCSDPAVATMTADYEGRTMAVGPLSPLRQPPALDLCRRHGELLSPPDGWSILRHESTAAGGDRRTGPLDDGQRG